MALEVEFACVIAKKHLVDRDYPGGLDAFELAQPNYAEDDNLLRVVLMSTTEALSVVDDLAIAGVVPDATCVVESRTEVPAWLHRGFLNGKSCVWLVAAAPGAVVPSASGFILRGPPRTLGVIEALAEQGEISVRRQSGDVSPTETWELSRGEALLELRVVTTGGGGPVGLWAVRRRGRRGLILTDEAFARWLSERLTAAGTGPG